MSSHDRIYEYLANNLKSLGIAVQLGKYPSPGKPAQMTRYCLLKPKTPKALVLLLHGTGNDYLFPNYHALLQLSAAGYACLSIDLPGHGRGSTTILDEESMEKCVTDIIAFSKSLKLPDRIFIVGYSFGGALVHLALQKQSLNCQGAVFIGVPTRLSIGIRAAHEELKSLFSKTFLQEASRIGIYKMIPAFGPFKRNQFPIRLPANNPSKLSYLDIIERALNKIFTYQNIKPSSTPVLTIFGDKDHIAPFYCGRPILHQYHEAEFEVIPGLNHYMLSFDPTVDKLILLWLDKHC